jgi:hypothetical protein
MLCIYLFEIVDVYASGFDNGACLFYILIWNCTILICLFEFLSYVFVWKKIMYFVSWNCITYVYIFEYYFIFV